MRKLFFFALLSAAPLYASDDEISIPSHKLLIKKNRKRPSKSKNYHPQTKPTTYSLYYGSLAYDQYIGKLEGREAYLTWLATCADEFYCNVKLKSLLLHKTALNSADKVAEFFTQGDALPLDPREKCIACEENPSQYANPECGHMCLCETCSDKVDRCPICRTYAQKFIRIYSR